MNKKIFVIGLVILFVLVAATTAFAAHLNWQHMFGSQTTRVDGSSGSGVFSSYGYDDFPGFPGTLVWAKSLKCDGPLGERVQVMRYTGGDGWSYVKAGCAQMTPTPAP